MNKCTYSELFGIVHMWMEFLIPSGDPKVTFPQIPIGEIIDILLPEVEWFVRS